MSLIPAMAVSVRIFKLFTTKPRSLWSVGSLPYLLCHLATCASESDSEHHGWFGPSPLIRVFTGTVESNHPSHGVFWIGGVQVCESNLKLRVQGLGRGLRVPRRPVCGLGDDPIFQADSALEPPGSDIPDTIASHACSHWHMLDLLPPDLAY